jgi:glycine dehydrogenase subunit 1
VYLSLLGKEGLVELARICAAKADYLRGRLLAVPGVTMRFGHRAHLNEFVVNLPMAADKVIRGLFGRGLAAGFPLVRYFPEMNNCLLVAVTEQRTKEDMDFLAHSLEVILCG